MDQSPIGMGLNSVSAPTAPWETELSQVGVSREFGFLRDFWNQFHECIQSVQTRSANRDSALSVQAAYWEQFESFVADFYDSELLAIDELVEVLIGKRTEGQSGAESFQSLRQRAERLIAQITTGTLQSHAA